MTDEIWRWDATRVAEAVRSKEVSCREVIESVLARIDSTNPTLNAITVDLETKCSRSRQPPTRR